jgi:hypothetical protein
VFQEQGVENTAKDPVQQISRLTKFANIEAINGPTKANLVESIFQMP